MRAMNAGPSHQRIELALLRSPWVSADLELQVIQASWERACFDANPVEGFDIAAGRKTLEWARSGAAHLAGVLKASLEGNVWPNRRVLTTVLECENPQVRRGFGAFGFTAYEAAEMERELKQRKAAGLA